MSCIAAAVLLASVASFTAAHSDVLSRERRQSSDADPAITVHITESDSLEECGESCLYRVSIEDTYTGGWVFLPEYTFVTPEEFPHTFGRLVAGHRYRVEGCRVSSADRDAVIDNCCSVHYGTPVELAQTYIVTRCPRTVPPFTESSSETQDPSSGNEAT